MSQETPSAPSAQEAPEYAARMQQVRQIGQGSKGRGGKRKARQMREALRAGTVDDDAQRTQSFESACSSDTLTNGSQDQERFETWDELFGIDGKEQEGERRDGIFSSLVQQAMGALFCADDEQRRFAGKRKKEQRQAALQQDRPKEDMRVFGQMADDATQDASCNQSDSDACQPQQAVFTADEDVQPKQHVRPPQKRQLVYVTQQEGARKPGFAWVLAVSASTSFAVSVAVVVAMGMMGAGDAQLPFAGWLL